MLKRNRMVLLWPTDDALTFVRSCPQARDCPRKPICVP